MIIFIFGGIMVKDKNKLLKDIMNSESNGADNFADTVKKVGIARGISRVIKGVCFILFAIAFFIFCIKVGVPYYVVLPFVGFFIVMLVLEIVSLKRVASVNIKSRDNTEVPDIPFDDNEKIIDYTAGIMRTGQGSGSYGIMGVGKNMAPENTLIITENYILAITIPVSGAGDVISGVDISKWIWMVQQKELQEKFKSMLESMSLKDMIRASEKTVILPMSQVKKFKKSDLSYGITFIMNDLRKHTYSIRSQEDYRRISTFLENMFVQE